MGWSWLKIKTQTNEFVADFIVYAGFLLGCRLDTTFTDFLSLCLYRMACWALGDSCSLWRDMLLDLICQLKSIIIIYEVVISILIICWGLRNWFVTMNFDIYWILREVIFLQTHLNVTKEERKTLCKLIDSQKLSIEASLHAAQNERLPVRSVIQVLFSEQTKLHAQANWSHSIANPKSPNLGSGLSDRCHSSRDIMTLQQMEMKRLKDHVSKLERQCQLMQSQIDKLLEKKKGFFSWRKFANTTTLGALGVEVANERVEGRTYDSGSIGKQTPVKGKHGRSKAPKPWRQSTS